MQGRKVDVTQTACPLEGLFVRGMKHVLWSGADGLFQRSFKDAGGHTGGNYKVLLGDKVKKD